MSEYPLCSCDECWCGPGRHSPECHVVAKFKELYQQLETAMKAMRDSDELANAGFYDDAAEVIAKALKEQDK